MKAILISSLFLSILTVPFVNMVESSNAAVSFPPERADKPLPRPNCPKGSTCSPRG